MGMSIDIHMFDIEKLKEAARKTVTVKEGLLPVDELIDKALPKFGIVHDNYFVVQTADYWDDYCPWYEVNRFFESYYGDYWDDAFDKAQVAWTYDGANADEIADELGIELGTHPDDEDEEED